MNLLKWIYTALFCLLACTAEAQQRFASAEDAATALARAADSEDPAAFTVLMGAKFAQEVTSGDPQADKIGVQRLGTLLRQGYELIPDNNVTFILKIGADGWRFPIPIAKTTAGEWVFNVKAGKDALLHRRIEKNEERVIKIADFYATAQNKYKTMTGTYAAKFLSSAGAKNGLYWEPGPDGIVSPLEPLVERAQNLGYEREGRESPIISGYNFEVLTSQGEYAPGKSQSYIDAQGNMTKGFALFAYPTRYGVSGKMSFIVGADGAVYQKDFGARTLEIAAKIKRYDPDPSWAQIGGKINVAPKRMRYIETGQGAYPFYTD